MLMWNFRTDCRQSLEADYLLALAWIQVGNKSQYNPEERKFYAFPKYYQSFFGFAEHLFLDLKLQLVFLLFFKMWVQTKATVWP